VLFKASVGDLPLNLYRRMFPNVLDEGGDRAGGGAALAGGSSSHLRRRRLHRDASAELRILAERLGAPVVFLPDGQGEFWTSEIRSANRSRAGHVFLAGIATWFLAVGTRLHLPIDPMGRRPPRSRSSRLI